MAFFKDQVVAMVTIVTVYNHSITASVQTA